MIKEIKPNIIRLSFTKFGSHVYLIKLENKTAIIDTGSLENQEELMQHFEKINIKPEEIDIVILTHNHPDHVGGISLFPNAKFYASENDFGKNLIDIKNLDISEFEIIETPGHTKGGICILYEDVLFSGDTLFHRGTIGRTDLPGSDIKEMKQSLEKLEKINYQILCPGHGRE